MVDELYQEFFLSLCEITDNRLIEAQQGGYLDVFCVGIIYNLWGKRGRVKTYGKGKTSSLHESRHVPIYQSKFDADLKGAYKLEMYIEGGIETNENFDDQERALAFIDDLISTAKESEDKDQRFIARVFEYSTATYKNARQFAAASGIPYHVCRNAKNKFQEQIKTKINDIPFNIAV